MTYFGFLARFLLVPLILLTILLWRDVRRQKNLPAYFQTWPAANIIAAHVALAVIYTTPWDNYLVATAVWWYDPDLVTGIVLGWVPIEEYTFFVLQTLLTGLWVVWLARRVDGGASFVSRPALRRRALAVTAGVWAVSTLVLLSGWMPATYLTLILSWALGPLVLQLGFGADILWHYRRLVLWGLLPPSLYLGVADALAIRAGTWTISSHQTLNIELGGILPVEEFTFFLVTNSLVVLGVILMLAVQSHRRANFLLTRLIRRRA